MEDITEYTTTNQEADTQPNKILTVIKSIGFICTSSLLLVSLKFATVFPLDQSDKTLADAFTENFWATMQLPSYLLLWFASLVFLERIVRNKPRTFLVWFQHFISVYILWVLSFEILRYVYIEFNLVPCSDWCGIELFTTPLFIIPPIVLLVSTIRLFSEELLIEIRPVISNIFNALTSTYLIVIIFFLGAMTLGLVAFDYNTQGRHLGMSVRHNSGGNEYALKREIMRNEHERYCAFVDTSEKDACQDIYEKFCSIIQYKEGKECKESFFRETIPKLSIVEKVGFSPQVSTVYMNCTEVWKIYRNPLFEDKPHPYCVRTNDDEFLPPGVIAIKFQMDTSHSVPVFGTKVPMKNLFLDDFLPQFLLQHTKYTFDRESATMFFYVSELIDSPDTIYSELSALALQEKELSDSWIEVDTTMRVLVDRDFGFEILYPANWGRETNCNGTTTRFTCTNANYSLSKKQGDTSLPLPTDNGSARIDIATGCTLKDTDDFKEAGQGHSAAFKTICKDGFQFVLWLWGGDSNFTKHASLLNEMVASFKII